MKSFKKFDHLFHFLAYISTVRLGGYRCRIFYQLTCYFLAGIFIKYPECFGVYASLLYDFYHIEKSEIVV